MNPGIRSKRTRQRAILSVVVLGLTVWGIAWACGWGGEIFEDGKSLSATREYRNPVLPGFYPDPSIVRVAEDYYLVTSSFEYFPGIPIFHSRDLVNWRQIGHVLTRESQLPLDRAWSSGGVFAPTLRYHDGIFYVITTNVGRGDNFYVTAADPAGPWSDPIFVNRDGMDPSLLFLDAEDGSETRVFYTSQRGRGGASHIVQAEIDIETGKLQGPLLPVWQGTGGPWTEGPHLYAIEDQFYLLAAEGGTRVNHSSVIARSDRPEGPFQANPENPIATHRGWRGPVGNVGHADFVQTAEGHWFAVLLGVRVRGDPPVHVLGRETFLAPVTWSDGWPSIGDGGRISQIMSGSLPPPTPWPPKELRDDFGDEKLGLVWNFLRNPHEGVWSLADRPGWLRLRGRAVTLDSVGAPAFVGRRQQHVRFRASTRMEFDPQLEGEEAGLALRMTDKHHAEIVVTREGGRLQLILKLRNGERRHILARHAIAQAPLLLEITSDAERYRFAYRVDGGEERALGEFKVGLLSSEVSNSMTGVYIALYASGNGAPSQAVADFDWFEYQAR